MKRRSKKSKGRPSDTIQEEPAENGTAAQDSSSEAAEPSEKRRKISKTPTKGRKSAAKKNSEPPPEDSSELSNEDGDSRKDETQYEVQKILDQKTINGVRHYLIRWKGYEPESDTWEPASTLNCADLIKEFVKKQKKTKSEEKPKKRAAGRPSKTTPNADNEEWDENEDFEVERILDVYFKKNGQREFLVSWKGYPTSQNSWEPEENMDCKDLIERFMDKVKSAKNSGRRELRVYRTPTDHFTLSTQEGARRLSKRHSGKQRVHYTDAE